MSNLAPNQKVAIVPLFVKKTHVASLWFVPKANEEPSFTAMKAMMGLQSSEDVELGSSTWVEQESIRLTRIIASQKIYYLWFKGRTTPESMKAKLSALQQGGVMGAIKILDRNTQSSNTLDGAE
ncbi:MAG: hypothetical protein AAF438_09960 [Pseudomonadota bacterium]